MLNVAGCVAVADEAVRGNSVRDRRFVYMDLNIVFRWHGIYIRGNRTDVTLDQLQYICVSTHRSLPCHLGSGLAGSAGINPRQSFACAVAIYCMVMSVFDTFRTRPCPAVRRAEC